MTRSIFGWSLPPGCTQSHIDEAFGGDEPPCPCCGNDPANCECPECPSCGECGNPNCYNEHGLDFTQKQLIARCRLRIDEYKMKIADEEQVLAYLESETCVGCGQTIDYCTCNQFDSERK